MARFGLVFGRGASLAGLDVGKRFRGEIGVLGGGLRLLAGGDQRGGEGGRAGEDSRRGSSAWAPFRAAESERRGRKRIRIFPFFPLDFAWKWGERRSSGSGRSGRA